MEIAGIFKAGICKVGVAKIDKKVAIAKDQLGKKIVIPRLCDSLPATIIDKGVIGKREKG